jgi:hypothetical protein
MTGRAYRVLAVASGKIAGDFALASTVVAEESCRLAGLIVQSRRHFGGDKVDGGEP